MSGKLVLIIAVVLILAMPFMALARMSSLDDVDLDEVLGQTGVSIDLTFHVIDSYIAWEDGDGNGGTTTKGALTLSGFKIDSDGSGGDLDLQGLTYDVGATGAGVGYLAIGLPDMVGFIKCTSLKIGTGDNKGGGLGQVVIGDLETLNSTIMITPY